MSQRSLLSGFLLAVCLVSRASATQPNGIFAIIDKVVLEGDEKSPERIQIQGAFSIAKKANNYDYEAPVRGCLYFHLKDGKEEASRKEWNDLKKLAGSGKVVAFGNRREALPTIRKAEEKLKDPDAYATSFGLHSFDADVEYPPIRALFELVSPVKPLDRAEVDPGKITLVLRESIVGEHRQARIFFEIEGPNNVKEMSPGEAPGNKESSWTPKLELTAGGKYTWRVWAADDQWKSSSRTSTFTVKGKAKAKQ